MIEWNWSFFQGVKHIWNSFFVISLKICTKKTQKTKFYYEIALFSFHFFNLTATS